MLCEHKVVLLCNTCKQIDLTHTYLLLHLLAKPNTHVSGLVSICCVQHIFKHVDYFVCPCFMFLIKGCFAGELTGKGVAWVML